MVRPVPIRAALIPHSSTPLNPMHLPSAAEARAFQDRIYQHVQTLERQQRRPDGGGPALCRQHRARSFLAGAHEALDRY
jgi:hypothetical protein